MDEFKKRFFALQLRGSRLSRGIKTQEARLQPRFRAKHAGEIRSGALCPSDFEGKFVERGFRDVHAHETHGAIYNPVIVDLRRRGQHEIAGAG